MGVSVSDDECRYLCQEMIMKGRRLPLQGEDAVQGISFNDFATFLLKYDDRD